MKEKVENLKEYEHEFNFRVPLSYIDMAGVLYNGNYLGIFDQARDAYLRDIGFSYIKLYTEEQCHLSVVEVNIKYRTPIHYDELIEIVTKVEKIGAKSLVFDQVIYKDHRKQLCTTARIVTVCTKTRKSEPLPGEFVNAIKRNRAHANL